LILALWSIKGVVKSPKLTALNLFTPAILLALLSNFGRLQADLMYVGSPILAGILLSASYIALAAWLMLPLFIFPKRLSKVLMSG